MSKIIILMVLSWSVCVGFDASAKPMEYYLPADELFDSSVPSPQVIFGQQLGQRHLRHDQIVSYLSILAASNPRAKLMDYGRTHEGRRLVLLAVSSAENINNLESLKNDPDILKIWNGFSIHGNESSGANASVLYAWYLLATNAEIINEVLKDTVILIDPTINPDGLDRFTTYVNNKRSARPVTDTNDISHNEHWPNGRTNHYWFDLNRDWLLLTQPESQARINQFQSWQPHVLTDHHEMGSNASFFFQPGVPERTNPLIPKKNIELTSRIAEFHAKALDTVGQSYYNKESFDDFFPGKGSTYPDLHGSVGILFEQSSARGGSVEVREGKRELSKGIRNQFLTARSTLIASNSLRNDLLSYKATFFENALKQARAAGFAGYVVDVSDRSRIADVLVDFFKQHEIEVLYMDSDITVKSHEYKKGRSLFIPLAQKQYTLIRSLFSQDTRFDDNTFYDISAWNLPMAFGLQWSRVGSAPKTSDEPNFIKAERNWRKQAVAYVIDWHSGDAPAALNYLLENNQKLHISAKPLSLNSGGQKVSFPAGSFVIFNNSQSDQDKLFADLSNIADRFGVSWKGVDSGLGMGGIDLGSPFVKSVKSPKVLMLVGTGVNAYQAGSIWHLFDSRALASLTKGRLEQLSRFDLSEYTHIIMPDGNYSSHIDKDMSKELKQWVSAGGALVSFQRGANWVEKNIQAKADDENKTKEKKGDQKDDQEVDDIASRPYAEHRKDFADRILGGAIVRAEADLTHPLSFGTHMPIQYVMAKGSSVLEESENPYVTALKAAAEPAAAGYISEHWKEKLTGAPLVVADRMGAGVSIRFGFNPNFRGYWQGTQQWLINAIYLSHLIERTPEN